MNTKNTNEKDPARKEMELLRELAKALAETDQEHAGQCKVRMWVREKQWESAGNWYYWNGRSWSKHAAHAVYLTLAEGKTIADRYGAEIGVCKAKTEDEHYADLCAVCSIKQTTLR